MPNVDYGKFIGNCAVNPPGGFEGPPIASAASITISHPVHKVTGTVAISTINPPYPGFVGFITLIATAAWTLATGANIALAATAVANQMMRLYYDGALWYHDSDAP